MVLSLLYTCLITFVLTQPYKQFQNTSVITFGENIQFMTRVFKTDFLIHFANSTFSYFGANLELIYSFQLNNGTVF